MDDQPLPLVRRSSSKGCLAIRACEMKGQNEASHLTLGDLCILGVLPCTPFRQEVCQNHNRVGALQRLLHQECSTPFPPLPPNSVTDVSLWHNPPQLVCSMHVSTSPRTPPLMPLSRHRCPQTAPQDTWLVSPLLVLPDARLCVQKD